MRRLLLVFAIAVGVLCGTGSASAQSAVYGATSVTPVTSGQTPCFLGTALVSCFQPIGSIDFLSFSKTDAGSLLTVAAPSVTVTNATEASVFYLSKDYGANFFDGNEVWQGSFTLSAKTGAAQVRLYTGFMATAAGSVSTVAGNSVGIQVAPYSTTQVDAILTEFNSGTEHDYGGVGQDFGLGTMPSTWYWTLSRSGATVTMKIYADALHTQQLGSTATANLVQNVNYRYFEPLCGQNGTGTDTETASVSQFSIVQQ